MYSVSCCVRRVDDSENEMKMKADRAFDTDYCNLDLLLLLHDENAGYERWRYMFGKWGRKMKDMKKWNLFCVSFQI